MTGSASDIDGTRVAVNYEAAADADTVVIPGVELPAVPESGVGCPGSARSARPT